MKTVGVDAYQDRIVKALKRSPLFSALDDATLAQVAGKGALVRFEPGEALFTEGEPADGFLVLLAGEARVLRAADGRTRSVEIARLYSPDLAGETGLLLDQPRMATVEAVDPVVAVRFDAATFLALFDRVRGFGLGMCRSLARRLLGGGGSAAAAPIDAGGPIDLKALLARVVDQGASDLHLSAGQRVRWRHDGQMIELPDSPVLDAECVLAAVDPFMAARPRDQFRETNDADFSIELPGLARFRVNLFRNHRGVSAVLRQIPEKVLSLEQLNLPPAVLQFCDLPSGLVLVTGPTGSGKSTTLAAMIDHINRKTASHILTLEDPLEFVHRSQRSLVNQREVGSNTDSFARALRAALREDPDVVLVGEMRDLETVALALEVANTGHLVFGTLHTNTAVGTVDRIINQFPPEQQAQVRATLADVLRGVVCQTLCRRAGGGRVAAVEILVVGFGIANQIREGKTHQIPNLMSTGQRQGNMLLNQHLEDLVKRRLVEPKEALSKAVDRSDLARRLGTDG